MEIHWIIAVVMVLILGALSLTFFLYAIKKRKMNYFFIFLFSVFITIVVAAYIIYLILNHFIDQIPVELKELLEKK